MITEDYVSFETAKLLREKGFDVNTFNKYADKEGATEEWYDDYRERMVRFNWNNGTLINPPTEPQSQYRVYGNTIPAPTLQMAMKWLREVHGLYITITHRFSHNADNDVCFGYYVNIDTAQDGEWLTYEEACEAAIRRCLENLI